MVIRSSISLVLLGIALGGCANTNTGAISGDKKAEKEADSEEESADPPQEVSGSFLDDIDCAYINGDTGAASSAYVGCGVYQSNKKLDPADRKFTLELHDDNGALVAMPTLPAGADSPWHAIGNLPTAYKAKGYLSLEVKEPDGKRKLYKKTTSLIRVETDLGTSQDGEPISTSTGTTSGTPSNSALKLQGFAYSALWRGGEIGFLTTLSPIDFCNMDGSIRTSLSELSKEMISSFGGLVPTTIEPMGGVVKLTDGNCFRQFSLLGSGGSALAAETGAGNCLLVRTGGNYLLIIDKFRNNDVNLTLSNLRELAAAKACR